MTNDITERIKKWLHENPDGRMVKSNDVRNLLKEVIGTPSAKQEEESDKGDDEDDLA